MKEKALNPLIMKPPKEQLLGLELTLRQIRRIAEADPELDTAYYRDRVAQSLTCVWAAINECNDPIEDSEQFISDVIREQRDIIENLLVQINAIPPDAIEPIPDTIRSPHPYEVANDTEPEDAA